MSTPNTPTRGTPEWLRARADGEAGSSSALIAGLRAAAERIEELEHANKMAVGVAAEYDEENDRLRAENEALRKDKHWQAFGKDVFTGVAERVAIDCMGEDDEEVMQLACKHGIAQEVAYDPALHGEIDVEPGTQIWFWSKARKEGA